MEKRTSLYDSKLWARRPRHARWAVLISGTGSNLSAILDTRPEIDVCLVVSSTPKAYGLVRARRAGVPTWLTSQPVDWSALDQKLREYSVDFIFLAGFMKLLPETFVQKWQGRIWNIHPSLLPAFPGLKSIEKAYEAGEPVGVTVHEVIPEMDAGPILAQKTVPVRDGQSVEQTEFMVHLTEHRMVRETVRVCKLAQT